ncbi:hypothetical protein IEA_05669 [Bacillus toyonensis]|nr:hypothetical protein IEA_05669 [Bacillus toyonensis]
MSLKETYIMTLIHNGYYKCEKSNTQLYEMQSEQLFELIKRRVWKK